MQNELMLVGILLAFLFTELIGISPGGVIVPAYFALYLKTPGRIVGTLILSLLTCGALHLAKSWLILYGRRRFVFAVTVSFGLGYILRLIPGFSQDLGFIGFLIPGILASEMDRQGVIKTLAATALVTGVLGLLTLLYPSLLRW